MDPTILLALSIQSSKWVFLTLSFCALIWLLHSCLRLIDYFWWTPRRLRLIMEKQGVRGPTPQLVLGTLVEMKKLMDSVPEDAGAFGHGLLDFLMPDYMVWSKLYGKRYLFWWGPEPALALSDINLLKEVFSSKHALSYGKPYLAVQKFLEPLTGMGLATANGEDWAHQRQVVGPAFHFDRLKGLAGMMVKTAEKMLDEWDQIDRDESGKAEVEIGEHMTKVTADVIALTQFGSNYTKGKKVFKHLEYLRTFIFRYGHYLIMPGSRFLPTSSFREMRKVKQEVEKGIREIIQERKDSMNTSYGTDLLGLILAESERVSEDKKQPQLTVQQLVDECKTFFFAGQETTAQLLTWCMLLLAANPSWQERARAEVVEICHGSPPNTHSLSRMKTLEMILYETLRLYPAVLAIARVALRDMNLGDLYIPKGMSIFIPILPIHLDPELWGDDAHEFKPERFANGLGKACKNSLGFMPFAYGPRNCVGQNFALMEAKIIIAMTLMRFKLCASPNYRHSPKFAITLRPNLGAPIILQSLHMGS